MSTRLLESALAEMFPPNLAIHRSGWIVRDGQPVRIDYVLGFDETGHPYMHEQGTLRGLEMTPVDTKEDLGGFQKGKP